MTFVSEAIQEYLDHQIKSNPQSADLLTRVKEYGTNIELQINADKESGYPIRIPKNAKSTPCWQDFPLSYSPAHIECVGSTGWDWQERRSVFVAFDVDSDINHNSVGLTQARLEEVKAKAGSIEWVETRTSTSGLGLHLYVWLENVAHVSNHTQHAEVAKHVLSLMSGEAGFDFAPHVDTLGSNIWVAARRASPKNNSFGLIKAAERKLSLKTHSCVSVPSLPADTEFEQLTRTYDRVELDATHHEIIAKLNPTRWNEELHCLETHTRSIAAAYPHFKTASSGSSEINCYCWPLPNGWWKVYRFGENVNEHSSWNRDGSWTWRLFGPDFDFRSGMPTSKDNEFLFGSTADVEHDIDWGCLEGRSVKVLVRGRNAYLRVRKEKSDKPPTAWHNSHGHWELTLEGVIPEDVKYDRFADLAQQFLNDSSYNGKPTLAFIDGEFQQWTPDNAYIKQASRTVRARLRGTIVQSDFDGPIGTKLLGDGVAALEQLTLKTVPPTLEAPFWLDDSKTDPNDLLVLRNGILNLRTRTFSDLTPTLFYVNQAQFDYEPNAEPEHWLSFLESLDQPDDWLRLLQQIGGYLLWRGYSLQKYFAFVGPTRAGKGVIQRTFAKMHDPRADGSLRLSEFASPHGLEALINKPLTLVPEPPSQVKDASQVASVLKAITGDDTVSVNRKNKAIVSMRMRTKILFSTNNFVELPDPSGALLARCIPLKFHKSFLDKEDSTLEERLDRELPGILNWMLEGLDDLLADGKFTLPQSSLNELEHAREESSPLSSFVEQCCEVDPHVGCTTTELYEHYKECCDDNPMSDVAFIRELKNTCPGLTKTRWPIPKRRKVTIKTESGRRPHVWVGIRPTGALK